MRSKVYNGVGVRLGVLRMSSSPISGKGVLVLRCGTWRETAREQIELLPWCERERGRMEGGGGREEESARERLWSVCGKCLHRDRDSGFGLV